jgi:putative transposase
MKPSRGYETLRAHRVSIPGFCYFVTVCTRNRVAGLTSPRIAQAITAELCAMKTDGAFDPRAWVILPDHIHLLFRVSETLSLGQAIGRLKARTRSALAEAQLTWQGNYHEHRLRADELVEDVLRYIYLNPYRAKLAAPTDLYPHFWLCEADRAWFAPSLDDNRPFPAWLLS